MVAQICSLSAGQVTGRSLVLSGLLGRFQDNARPSQNKQTKKMNSTAPEEHHSWYHLARRHMHTNAHIAPSAHKTTKEKVGGWEQGTYDY